MDEFDYGLMAGWVLACIVWLAVALYEPDPAPVRRFALYKIKRHWLRRLVIVITFPWLLVTNLLLWLLAVVVFCGRNQGELFRSARHYWGTSARIED